MTSAPRTKLSLGGIKRLCTWGRDQKPAILWVEFGASEELLHINNYTTCAEKCKSAPSSVGGAFVWRRRQRRTATTKCETQPRCSDSVKECKREAVT